MTLVFRPLRSVTVLLLAANVGAGSAFAPEHVHERDDRHPTATLHRHLAPHHAPRSNDPAHVDDDDDHIVWLTTAWLQTTVYHVPPVTSAPAIISIVPPVGMRWTALVLDEAAPPHGPPRAPRSLRAPPLPCLT
jgi:hypothetical protein